MGLPNRLSFGLTADRSVASLWHVDILGLSSFSCSSRCAGEVLVRERPFMTMLESRVALPELVARYLQYGSGSSTFTVQACVPPYF